MKTKLHAAALMMIAAAASAAPSLTQREARPRRDAVSLPGPVLDARKAQFVLVPVQLQPVEWISAEESMVGVAVSAPTLFRERFTAQLFLDGVMRAQETIPSGSTRLLQIQAKSDGLRHELRLRVWREVIDEPHVLVKEQVFDIDLPSR